MEKPLFSWARPWSATRDKLRNSLATRVGRLWRDRTQSARQGWQRVFQGLFGTPRSSTVSSEPSLVSLVLELTPLQSQNTWLIINWPMSGSSFAALTASLDSNLGNGNGAFYAEIEANLRPQWSWSVACQARWPTIPTGLKINAEFQCFSHDRRYIFWWNFSIS